jgi:hypothetical protein
LSASEVLTGLLALLSARLTPQLLFGKVLLFAPLTVDL